MKKIKIADGLELSWLALGECRRGDPDAQAGAFAIMDRYRELGGDTFDSARMYHDGGSDRAMGEWMRSRKVERDDIVIVTKGSHNAPSSWITTRLTPEEIERDLDESLSFMGIAHSDLHLLHRDDIRIPVERIVPALSGLVAKGKARAVGVSNWTVGRIIQANQFALENGFEPIRCSQLLGGLALTTSAMSGDLTHIVMNDVEFGWYRESRLPLMCFGAQARGWFAARAAGREPKPSPQKFYDPLPENYRRLARLERLSGKLGRSFGALTAAYARDRGLNACVLSSFSSPWQLEEAFEAETFTLTPGEIKYLETGLGTC
ncbi:MAG: aldo/keto reductase [Firmicutes bacterium]|nr:aldo/keto reductase [Bacillota bacterium]